MVSPKNPQAEVRWPVLFALLALGLLNFALPPTLIVGPRWVVLVVLAGIGTLTLVGSLALLIAGLPKKSETPAELARSSACLWVANVLVFAIWYWRLDAGGPFARDGRGAHTEGDFFFPQMMEGCPGPKNWTPRFVDYLFIAFNNSTAFSPTDTPILSRWAKVLTMLQSLISLLVVAVLASRAVGLI